MKQFATLVVLFWTAPGYAADSPRKPIDRSGETPDFCQTDPAGGFPDKGGDFCGPVAVSNSLMYLAKNSFPKLLPAEKTEKEAQIELIHRLASKEYMDTVEKDGTSPPRLMAGVQRLAEDSGYKVIRLEQQGWKEATAQFPQGAEMPSLNWIKDGLSAKGGAVWLNVGWYKADAKTNEYRRIGGHWVTLVGYGKDRDGKEDSLTFMIHDPAPRTGMKPLTQWVRFDPLEKGFLQRDLSTTKVQRRAAKGFFEMKGEMKLKTNADVAILDAAVVLELK